MGVMEQAQDSRTLDS